MSRLTWKIDDCQSLARRLHSMERILFHSRQYLAVQKLFRRFPSFSTIRHLYLLFLFLLWHCGFIVPFVFIGISILLLYFIWSIIAVHSAHVKQMLDCSKYTLKCSKVSKKSQIKWSKYWPKTDIKFGPKIIYTGKN